VSEILIRVHAAGVNPIDGANRETGAFVGQPPFVLGWDVSGTVEAVGPGVTLYAPGDDVFGLLPFPQGHGAYAEYVVGPARVFVRKPDRLDHVQAAAVPMVGLTAWQALVDTAQVADGSRVLIIGAAGGIGHLAVQIAKARGAHVTALASAGELDFVRSLGADEGIDYTGTDFTEAVRDQDVVLDVVGGDYPARVLDVLRSGGVRVSTQPPALAPLPGTAADRGIRLAGIIVEADQVGLRGLADLASTGKLVPTIAATFPLEEAAASAAADLASADAHFPLEQVRWGENCRQYGSLEDEMTHPIEWDQVTNAEVVRAIQEYDQLGPERFFSEHGFGPTTTYDLVWNESLYPPKAILGTAYEFATGHRLASGDFEGGKSGAVRVLGNLGFTIRPRS
jgi:NADPH:quinone reductase-like Zn-dependent oxidoreductase